MASWWYKVIQWHIMHLTYIWGLKIYQLIFFPFSLWLRLTLGVKIAFSCKFWAALISASISINFILFDISNIENMIAILLIRELCSPAIYFYLTLLSLFALKINIYHTCVIIRIWAIEIPSLTHHDIKVDIEIMVLAGPCNPKFHYQHHYFVNTHTK